MCTFAEPTIIYKPLTKLPAGYICILNAPGVITHCAPGVVVIDLHIAIVKSARCSVGGVTTIDQANRQVRLSEVDCMCMRENTKVNFIRGYLY